MYLPWAGYFEGTTDREYFKILIPRLMHDLISNYGLRSVTIPEDVICFGSKNRTIEFVAREACESKDSFHIWFVHADTGGRALARNISTRSDAYKNAANAMCDLPIDRCVVVAPRKETESWVLADRFAVLSAFGISIDHENRLPIRPILCESISDPKEILDNFARSINRKRYKNGASSLFSAIALVQNLDNLSQLPSFRSFENELKIALASLGCIRV